MISYKNYTLNMDIKPLKMETNSNQGNVICLRPESRGKTDSFPYNVFNLSL